VPAAFGQLHIVCSHYVIEMLTYIITKLVRISLLSAANEFVPDSLMTSAVNCMPEIVFNTINCVK
jgi:hypothetical protein